MAHRQGSPGIWSTLGLAAFLSASVLFVYWPAIQGGFLFDDEALLAANRLVQAGDGLYRIWLTSEPVDYWPLTNTTFWLEWRLWGTTTTGYHVTNIALHIAGALMLWRILRRLAVPGPYIGAFLFAVHPVNVASVAWIAERKNTLSLFFFLLSAWCFVKNLEAREPGGPEVRKHGSVKARKPGAASRRSRTRVLQPRDLPARSAERYFWFSFAAFALAMLSKGSAAVLPGVLLLVVWWRTGSIHVADVRRLLPFIAVGVGLTIVNVWFQHRAGESIRDATLLERLLGAGAVIWFYLGKALAPVGLLFAYPQWRVQASDPRWWTPVAATAAVTLVLWRCRRQSLGRGLFAAWLYFCGALVPVLGLTDVYFMKYSLVANHYEYIALVGVAATAGAGLAALAVPAWRRATTAAVVATLGVMTWSQSRVYADAETLYRATLAGNPSAWFVHNNLGALLVERGDHDEGVAELREAERLHPDPIAAKNLCAESARMGQFAEAIDECSRAIQLGSDSAAVHDNLGLALMSFRRFGDAERELRAAVALEPENAHARYNLGHLLVITGRPSDAVPHLRETVRLDPGSGAARNGLGEALRDAGDAVAAEQEFRAAIALRPDLADAHRNLADLLLERAELAEAAKEYGKLIQIAPQSPEAHNNLGVALTRLGKLEDARDQFRIALALRPDYPDAQANLSKVATRLAR